MVCYAAEKLGLPYLSSYLDSIRSNFRHGANFASGGATIRRQNESWFDNGVSPFPLDIQFVQYDQFKGRTTTLYNQGPCLIRLSFSRFQETCMRNLFLIICYDVQLRNFPTHKISLDLRTSQRLFTLLI